jgi:hypothetical protein
MAYSRGRTGHKRYLSLEAHFYFTVQAKLEALLILPDPW